MRMTFRMRFKKNVIVWRNSRARVSFRNAAIVLGKCREMSKHYSSVGESV